jgi:hypothetical protein
VGLSGPRAPGPGPGAAAAVTTTTTTRRHSGVRPITAAEPGQARGRQARQGPLPAAQLEVLSVGAAVRFRPWLTATIILLTLALGAVVTATQAMLVRLTASASGTARPQVALPRGNLTDKHLGSRMHFALDGRCGDECTVAGGSEARASCEV